MLGYSTVQQCKAKHLAPLMELAEFIIYMAASIRSWQSQKDIFATSLGK